MKKSISKKEFVIAEMKMNDLLAIVTTKGGFENLTEKERAELDKHNQIVKIFE